MNPKTLIAFALGVFVASGVAFLASRPEAPQKQPVEVAQAVKEPVAQAPEPEPVRIPPASVPEPVTAPKPRAAAKPTPVVTPAPAPAPSVIATAKPNKEPEKAPEPAPTSNAPIFLPPPPPPADLPAKVEPAPAPKPAVKEPPKPNSVTIPAGTMINARIMEPLSSERNQAGDSFQATLDQAVVIDGFVIAERGAKLDGRVTEVDRSGKVKGLARLVLEITKLHTSDGQVVQVQTGAFERKAESSTKSDAMKVGIGAAIGAAIGGIAGGGKGAATGAGVGGAAGAGQVLLTRGKAAEIKVETRIPFRLQEPLTLTEKLTN